MPQGLKATTELFMGASFDRLRLRLPDPEPSPVGLANAGFPVSRRGPEVLPRLGRRGQGADLPTRLSPITRAASATVGLPETPLPLRGSILMTLGKIQAQTC